MTIHTWFIFALLSALFAGLHAFTQKMAVERGYSSTVINILNTAVSAMLATSVVLYLGVGTSKALLYGLFLGALNGAMHMFGSIIRMDGLRYVDTAIFFPLYKTIGPIFTVIFGVLFFKEWFSANEMIGIVLGIVIPLLLIHKSEKTRQANLYKGLLFVVLSALFTAISATVAKFSTGMIGNVFLFVAASHAFGALSGLVSYKAGSRSNVFKPFKDKSVIQLGVLGGVLQFATFSCFMFAFKNGSLAIVYTINSFYILIPIILSIIFYKEHFNLRKALAIGLSILAILFLN